MMDVLNLDIRDLLDSYQKKQVKPSEVMKSYLAVANESKSLGAFLQSRDEETTKRAAELDNRMVEAAKLPLFGIPVAIKDNILVKGWQATAGSKILEGFTSPYTATCVERLEAAGAIVVGKTSCDEFAMGSSNETCAYGPVKNPWDPTRVPGGSSGGSAVAVAGQMCLGSLGTDTGGSIRQPASLCGIVGVKPTYGRVSRYGVIAYSSSLDQIGPFARTVWDSARVLEVMGGYDGKDSTSSRSVVPKYTESIDQASLKNVTVGVFPDWLEGIDSDVKTSFQEAVKAIQAAGAKVEEIKLPNVKYSLSTYYIIAPSEASSNLARYDGVHYGFRASDAKSLEELYRYSRGRGFGKEVKLRIMLGTYALSSGYYDAYYMKANAVRRLIQDDFEKAFQSVQCILAPTSPSTAFKFGEKEGDPIKMYLSDVFTLPVNLAGLPGISVPTGVDKQGLPIGMQFIGKAFDETKLFGMATAYEKIRGPFPLPRKAKGAK